MSNSGNYLLDTNVVIAILRNQPLHSPLAQDRLAISVITLGELQYGALKSARPSEGLACIKQFENAISVLDCTRITCEHFARLKQFLSSIGKPIPGNDVWIAAAAMEHNLTLVTRDAHFDAIPHLTKERW